MYYLYKRMMEEAVEEFRCLSEEEKQRDIYLHKHKYLGWLIERFLTVYAKWTFVVLIAVNVIFLAIYSMTSSYHKWEQILSLTMFLITCILTIAYSYSYVKFNSDKEKAQKLISQTILNIYLNNSKVVNWRKIKKMDEKFYQYLRSDECNKKAFTTTEGTAKILQDSKIKIIWMYVTQIGTNQKCKYAILKKGKWVYDTNLKRTYRFKDYMKCRQAEVFKEFSLNEGKYFTQDSYKLAWKDFDVWCEERGV